MRLLHTTSGVFEEFFDTMIPRYSILSHRWGNDEVSLQDLEAGRKDSGEGSSKIRKCCALAQKRGFDWVWIDTCCIDRKSSAELSEAINSMYRWYRNAGECYVYLSDVAWVQDGKKGQMEQSRKEFRNSKWFTRGWTLQELLAPEWVLFYDCNWNLIGQKSSDSMEVSELATEISSITKIDVKYINDEYLVPDACAAVKMSWVSRRQTSRSEDLAYCLLGIFDINMPLLYGEGEKAFFRLQSEIIKQNDDESIFAWITGPSSDRIGQRAGGLFAPTPGCFAESGTIECLSVRRPPWSMTNRGLEIRIPSLDVDSRGKARLRLNCWMRKDREFDVDPTQRAILISLRERPYRDEYYRVFCDKWLQDKAVIAPSAEEMKDTTCIYVLGLHD